MKSIDFLSHHREETLALGKKIALGLKKGDILCLFGDLGSGKTTLVQGIAAGLKINPTQVNSPTFVFMNVYEGKIPLFHFDLYRVETTREILALGYEEYFYDDGITVIEWAERLQTLLPQEYLEVKLLHQGEDQRLLKISAQGERYQKVVVKISS